MHSLTLSFPPSLKGQEHIIEKEDHPNEEQESEVTKLKEKDEVRLEI